jgi:hypothetical protein
MKRKVKSLTEECIVAGTEWLSPSEKRDQTLKCKLFDSLTKSPGKLAGDIPMAQRRFLREMERDDILECRVEHNDFRWYVK